MTNDASVDEYSCQIPSGTITSALSVPYEYEIVHRPGSTITDDLLSEIRRAMLYSVARASGLEDCATTSMSTNGASAMARSVGGGGEWGGWENGKDGGVVEIEDDEWRRDRSRSLRRGLVTTMVGRGRGSTSIVGIASEVDDAIVESASCQSSSSSSSSLSSTATASVVEDPTDSGGIAEVTPGMSGVVIVEGLGMGDGGGAAESGSGVGGNDGSSGGEGEVGDDGFVPVTRIDSPPVDAFNYLSTESLPLSRSSIPLPYDDGRTGGRRRMRTLLEEVDENVNVNNECTVVAGRVSLTTIPHPLSSYENLDGRVLDVLVRDANEMKLGLESNDVVIRVRMVDPYPGYVNGVGVTNDGDGSRVSSASASALEDDMNDPSTSSFWLGERNGIPGGMVTLVSMGAVFFAMMVLFVGTRTGKRRRVATIDGKGGGGGGGGGGGLNSSTATYRKEDVESDMATMPPLPGGGKERSGDVGADDVSTRKMKGRSDVIHADDVTSIIEDLHRSVTGGTDPVVASTSTNDDKNDVDDDYSIDAFSMNSAVRTPGITWTPVGTPVPIGRRRVSSRPRVVGDDIEMDMEPTPATPRAHFLDLFSNFGWPRLVSPDHYDEVEPELDRKEKNESAAVECVVPACGIDRTIPFIGRYFAPHAEVEASLLPVLVDDRPSVTQAKRSGDRIERGDGSRVANHATSHGSDTPLARTRVDAPPARMDESNDLVLTPNHLRSLSASLGRYASRGHGRSSTVDHDPPPPVDPPILDVDVSTKVDIREIREVASDITMPPLAHNNMDSPNRVYQSPSTLASRSRARRGNGRTPVRSPPRPKVGGNGETEDCPRTLEVCADGGGVELYDAGKFCTGDMTNFFPVDWGFDK
jgi:hypothetical protein